jgi:hypothetical protein
MATVINALEQVNSTTPKAKGIQWKWASVARTDTSAKDLFVIPKGSTIVNTILMGAVSDAGTTATVDVGNSGDADAYIDATNVLSVSSQTLAPAVAQGELLVDTLIQGIYAESGTASTAGGDWTIGIGYVRDISL